MNKNIIILFLFIIIICVIYLISFSNDNLAEGLESAAEVAKKAQEAAAKKAQEDAAKKAQEDAAKKAQEDAAKKAQEDAKKTSGITTSSNVPTTKPIDSSIMFLTTAPYKPTPTPLLTTMPSTTRPIVQPTVYLNRPPLPTRIDTNADFLMAVNSILGLPVDPSIDKVSVNIIQGLLSSVRSSNAATLLSEIGKNYNSNPRSILQYMNWFASMCPIDCNECDRLPAFNCNDFPQSTFDDVDSYFASFKPNFKTTPSPTTTFVSTTTPNPSTTRKIA